jgi:putative molybdopterin biosynthesis protein
MGGLTALRRGEAHLAGTHLLDEETGEYNISSVKRVLAGHKMILVNLSYRIQGMLVLPGNPKGIKSLQDLAGSGLRFINRQRGSGTRLLFDHLLKEEGIASSAVQGYEREEYTHMAVAVAVGSSVAVGRGVFVLTRTTGSGLVGWTGVEGEQALKMITVKINTIRHFFIKDSFFSITI